MIMSGFLLSITILKSPHAHIFIKPFLSISLVTTYIASRFPVFLANQLENMLNPARAIYRKSAEYALAVHPDFEEELVTAFLAKQAIKIDMLEKLLLEHHPPDKT